MVRERTACPARRDRAGRRGRLRSIRMETALDRWVVSPGRGELAEACRGAGIRAGGRREAERPRRPRDGPPATRLAAIPARRHRKRRSASGRGRRAGEAVRRQPASRAGWSRPRLRPAGAGSHARSNGPGRTGAEALPRRRRHAGRGPCPLRDQRAACPGRRQPAGGDIQQSCAHGLPPVSPRRGLTAAGTAVTDTGEPITGSS